MSARGFGPVVWAGAVAGAALGSLASQIRAGVGTFVIKPCQFIDDVARFPDFAAEVVEKANRIAEQIS